MVMWRSGIWAGAACPQPKYWLPCWLRLQDPCLTCCTHICCYSSALWEKTPWPKHQPLHCPSGDHVYNMLCYLLVRAEWRQYEAVFKAHTLDLASGTLISFFDKLLLKCPQDYRPSRVLWLGGALGGGEKPWPLQLRNSQDTQEA